MQHCMKRRGGRYNRIVYIGDGTWDRDACTERGRHFIGIGKKMRDKCNQWFDEYSDIGRVLRVFGGCTDG